MRVVALAGAVVALLFAGTPAYAYHGYTASVSGVVGPGGDAFVDRQDLFGPIAFGDTITIDYSYDPQFLQTHPGYQNPFYDVTVTIHGITIDLGIPWFQFVSVQTIPAYPSTTVDLGFLSTTSSFDGYSVNPWFAGYTPAGTLVGGNGNFLLNGPSTITLTSSPSGVPSNGLLWLDPFSDLSVTNYSRITFTPQTITVFENSDALPEPSTWATMLLGLAAVGIAFRRR